MQTNSPYHQQPKSRFYARNLATVTWVFTMLLGCGGSGGQGSTAGVGGTGDIGTGGGTGNRAGAAGAGNGSSTTSSGAASGGAASSSKASGGATASGGHSSSTSPASGGASVASSTTGTGSSVAATGGAGSAAAVEPVDTRPARPTWTSPFTTAVGTTGWEQSTQPICDANQGLEGAFNVWADTRGVFAVVAAGCNVLAGASCGKDGASVKFNDGSGWKLLYQFASGTVDYPELYGGFPDDQLVVGGTFDGQPSLAFVSKGSMTKQTEITEPRGAFAVSKDLAYAIDGMTLKRYSAGAWSKVGESTSQLLALWADSQTVIAVGADQTILMKTGTSALAPIPGVPAGVYGSVWAFGANDIWAGNTAGQLVHYDGSKWKTIETASKDTSGSGISHLWGAAGTLYFTTYSEMGRWNGTTVQMLLTPSADRSPQFSGIWGRSANEVFVALRDSTYKKYACGSAFMLWFDGTQFHQM